MENKNFRKRFLANDLHKELYMLVLVAAIIPMLLAVTSIFYLFFHFMAMEVETTLEIIEIIIPAASRVIAAMIIILPIIIGLILFYARRITHKIVGPFDRIVREVRETLDGKKQGHIVLRRGDKFKPLVDLINEMSDRLNK